MGINKNGIQEQTSNITMFIVRWLNILFLICIIFTLQGQELQPKISFSSYYRTSGDDDTDVVAVDFLGNTYLGGHSNSQNLPGASKYPCTINKGMDASVVKLNNRSKKIGYIVHLGDLKWRLFKDPFRIVKVPNTLLNHFSP